MEREKYVDESWKESVETEKGLDVREDALADGQARESTEQTCGCGDEGCSSHAGPAGAMEFTFFNYISSLAFQAMIFLGEIPNPMNDNAVEKNLDQAKLLIDTLVMLKDKTQGNLSKEEEDLLNASVYELQIKYVDQFKQDAG